MNHVREIEGHLDTSHINTNVKENITNTIMDTYSSILTAYTRLERVARRLVKEDKVNGMILLMHIHHINYYYFLGFIS
jgi:hypothetical protein